MMLFQFLSFIRSISFTFVSYPLFSVFLLARSFRLFYSFFFYSRFFFLFFLPILLSFLFTRFLNFIHLFHSFLLFFHSFHFFQYLPFYHSITSFMHRSLPSLIYFTSITPFHQFITPYHLYFFHTSLSLIHLFLSPQSLPSISLSHLIIFISFIHHSIFYTLCIFAVDDKLICHRRIYMLHLESRRCVQLGSTWAYLLGF